MSTGLSSQTPSSDDSKSQGYHRLADLMSNDKNLAIFRRFDELNILSLLTLQAEIFELNCQLGRGNQNELQRDEQSKGLLDDLREKLAKYNELLLQVSQLSKLENPKTSELENLKIWLVDERGGNRFQKGAEASIWKDDPSVYLCVGPVIAENDPFTKLVTNVLVGIYHPLCGKRLKTGRVLDETGLTSYNERKVDTASNVIATVLSSILPVVTIFVLNILPNTNLRIGLTALFTAIFAFFLATFSSARRVEIFAATATFAAVEVVFIGSAISSTTDAAAASTNTPMPGVMSSS